MMNTRCHNSDDGRIGKDGEKCRLSEEDLRKAAVEVCKRGLEVPAVFMLELYKPLTGILHAGSLVFVPLLTMLFGGAGAAEKLTAMLESREYIEQLIVEIEKLKSGSGGPEGQQGDLRWAE